MKERETTIGRYQVTVFLVAGPLIMKSFRFGKVKSAMRSKGDGSGSNREGGFRVLSELLPKSFYCCTSEEYPE